ncbi:M28 family peptidase [Micromonospora sp. NBC_01796]|uniref:M28 family peptidase n=1 Tax=Micromonospora sp. NBC_01796 TaxID=2975987 RepID=UPI002DDBDD01|nr:M28 family peptidase [Micromonospora sp. NBC_01796]WSA87882.1 M28 family peptidase [Micromonospora sp. NBC_01796]
MATSVESPLEHAPPPTARRTRRGLTAAAALAVLVAIGAAALLDLRTPAPVGTDSPAGQFSAGRAAEHLEVVGARTHVAGSPANDQVRAYLESTLRDLGLSTQVQDTVAEEAGQLSGAAGGATLARVRNVVARIPGTDPTGRVFLVAHYDSVQSGPGGNDDAVGTSAILEVARALSTGPRPRNDIVFVLTDAEEACLCGASAFASGHPLAADGGVVLNLEARGSTGPVIMFETSPDNAGLVGVFGRAAPHAVGTSFAVEVYRLLPNDTDFTAFLDHGFTGLNSAYLDGGAIYHTPLDTPARVDRGSLQQHGDNALALAREFGATDLADLRAGNDATYFPVPGTLVRYPGWLTWPLALLAVVAVGLLGWTTRRRGHASWSRMGAGFGLALVPIVVAPVLAQLLWLAITTIRPGYAELLDPYRPVWYRLAVLALAAAVLLGWYALFRRRIGAAALAVGGVGWLAVLGVLLAVLTPGGAYLATLPALAGAAGGLVALAVRPGSRWAVVAVTAGAAVGVLILLPTVMLLFPALGMAMGGVAALFAVLLGLGALPVLDLLHPALPAQPPGTAPAEKERTEAEHAGPQPTGTELAENEPSEAGQAGAQPTGSEPAGPGEVVPGASARRRGAVPALAAALAALVLAGIGLAVDRFDAEHPVPTHLMYALDTNTGTARWLSHETDPQSWTAKYVRSPVSTQADFPALGDDEMLAGPAQAATLPAPALTVLAERTDGDRRTLRLRLTPQRQVRLASLHVAASTATVVRATVAGRDVPVASVTDGGPWSFGLVFHAPPTDGIEIELVLSLRGGPVSLRAMDASDDLSGLPGFRPRPADVGVVGSHSSEMVAVAHTYSY